MPDREQFRGPPGSARQHRAAWIDLLFVDFGLFRLIWKNREQISARAWRANQPFPADIAWAADQGIRTIVTARHDPRHGGNALEMEACAAHHLALETIPFYSREAPARDAILAAATALERIEYPVLFHCKSGADRAGFLSALYMIVIEQKPVAEARNQLSLRFMHIRQSKTGILDAVFDAYIAQTQQSPKPFLDWVREDYDSEALKAAFRHGYFADLLDRFIFRHE